TGNHDIGYSGDMNQHRVKRWKEAFGEMNFIDWVYDNENDDYDYDDSDDNNRIKKSHKLAIINSMNVDGPALDEVMLHVYTYISICIKLDTQECYYLFIYVI